MSEKMNLNYYSDLTNMELLHDSVPIPEPEEVRDSQDDEDSLFDPEVEAIMDKFKNKSKGKNLKRKGRRSSWTSNLEDDLVDIIASNENYKRKLIYENMRKIPNANMYEEILRELKARAMDRQEECDFDVGQVRTKFKNFVGECKKAALTVKTGTGIARHREEKGFGKWFDVLYPLVKARDSCQPEQGIEPVVMDEEEGQNDDDRDQAKIFVPLKPNSKKRRMEDVTVELVKSVNRLIDQPDNTTEILNYMKEENERRRNANLQLIREENKQMLEIMRLMVSENGNQPGPSHSYSSFNQPAYPSPVQPVSQQFSPTPSQASFHHEFHSPPRSDYLNYVNDTSNNVQLSPEYRSYTNTKP